MSIKFWKLTIKVVVPEDTKTKTTNKIYDPISRIKRRRNKEPMNKNKKTFGL